MRVKLSGINLLVAAILATLIVDSVAASEYKLLVLPLNPGQKCPNNVEQVVNSCAKCSCYFDAMIFCKTSCDLVSIPPLRGYGGGPPPSG